MKIYKIFYILGLMFMAFAWTTQIQLNGQFIGLTNTGTLEPVPFRGKYKI